MKTWINKLGSVLFASLLTLMLNGKAFAETDSVGEEPGVEIIEPAEEAGASTAAAETTAETASEAAPETAAETAAGTVLPSGPASGEETAAETSPAETAPSGTGVVVGTAPGGEQN